VTRGGAGFVAVGRVFAGTFRGGRLGTAPYAPAIWRSRDGRSWKRVDITNAVGKGPSSWELTDVAAHNGSFYATATVGAVTVILRSEDGGHWQRFGTPTGTFNRMIEYDGFLVAVGSQSASIANGGAPERAGIWISSDGRHWHRVATSAAALFSRYEAVTARGRALAAVGVIGNHEVLVDGILAVSNDGRAWKSVTTSGTVFAPGTELSAVTAFGRRFVAFGHSITADAAGVFRSRSSVFLSSVR
jgi:hypothetical protein